MNPILATVLALGMGTAATAETLCVGMSGGYFPFS